MGDQDFLDPMCVPCQAPPLSGPWHFQTTHVSIGEIPSQAAVFSLCGQTFDPNASFHSAHPLMTETEETGLTEYFRLHSGQASIQWNARTGLTDARLLWQPISINRTQHSRRTMGLVSRHLQVLSFAKDQFLNAESKALWLRRRPCAGGDDVFEFGRSDAIMSIDHPEFKRQRLNENI
jgi:hypothetical protein